MNGVVAINTELRSEIENKGIWIQCGSAKGPLSKNLNGQPRISRLTIQRLRVGDNMNRLGASFASSGQLEMLLKLPRRRKHDVPDSVLCSTNGDLLRGHLLAANANDIRFRSRFEEFELRLVLYRHFHTISEICIFFNIHQNTLIFY